MADVLVTFFKTLLLVIGVICCIFFGIVFTFCIFISLFKGELFKAFMFAMGLSVILAIVFTYVKFMEI